MRMLSVSEICVPRRQRIKSIHLRRQMYNKGDVLHHRRDSEITWPKSEMIEDEMPYIPMRNDASPVEYLCRLTWILQASKNSIMFRG
jgi:hypothetical protein